MTDLTYDIVGGSFGGCAAALSAAAGGTSVCLIEASDWLGGQYSAQGVTKPDESQYAPTVGSTATYRAFQHEVPAFYRNNYRFSPSGAPQPSFSPGTLDTPHRNWQNVRTIVYISCLAGKDQRVDHHRARTRTGDRSHSANARL